MEFRKNARQNLKRDIESIRAVQYIAIDCKGGFHDLQAMIVALKLANNCQKNVVGITCVAGGSDGIEGAVKDAILALKMTGYKPTEGEGCFVYRGSKQSMLLRTDSPKTIANSDQSMRATIKKLRDTVTEEDIKQYVKGQESDGIRFLVESGKKYKEKFGVLALGPLTNLAIAYHLDYSFGDFTLVSAYGGQLSGVGNVIGQFSAQSNFNFDPHAAHLVLKNFSQNVYLSPLEFALEYFLSEEDMSEITQSINARKQHKEEYKTLFSSTHFKFPFGWGQILAVIPIFQPKAVLKQYLVYAQVSLESQKHISGFMSIDWLRVKVPGGLDQEKTRIYSQFDSKIVLEALKISIA